MATDDEQDTSQLEQFLKIIESNPPQKVQNAIMFLGNTGDGKSTLTQFLAGVPNLNSEGQRGQYTITDKTGRISAPEATIHSQTIEPHPFPYGNPDDSVCLLDCPGFHDTRSSYMDAFCSIVTKRALKFCKRGKLILVISEHAVKIGGSRNSFLELAKHIFEFVKNFEKFKDSVALFVTKVTKLEGITDEDVVMNIKEYLENARQTIQGLEKIPKEKRTEYANTLTLINSLLRDGKRPARICIFPCPSKQGSLIDMPGMKKYQFVMNRMIQEILQFTQITEEDFGYSLSADSKNEFSAVVERIMETVAGSVKRIMKEIENVYGWIEDEESSNDLYQIFQQQCSIWDKMHKKLKSTNKTCDFLCCLQEHILHWSRTFSKYETAWDFEEDIAKLKKYIEMLEQLQTISNTNFHTPSNHLLSLFEEVFGVVRNADIWYKFMKTLPSYFSTYDFQRKIDSVKILAFMSIIKKWKEETKLAPVEAIHLRREFKKLCDRDLDSQINFSLNFEKLEHLYRLFKSVFVENSIRIVGNRIRIKGHYLLLNKIVAKIPSEIEELEVFASGKIFIDCDLLAIGKNMQILIAAPEWEVIGGHRKIVLDGAPGPDYPAAARNRNCLDSEGKNGRPGKPGTSGGIFLGVGEAFENVENLKVTACGGRGGNGEDGGEGYRGCDGADATLPADIFDPRLSCHIVAQETNSGRSFFNDWDKNSIKFNIPGGEGTRGGNGGNGGSGGIGGYPGQVLFIGCGSDDLPNTISAKGDDGQGGKGGRGGPGGKQGRTLEGNAKRNTERILLNRTNEEERDYDLVASEVVAEHGLEGQSNANDSRREKPSPCECKNFVKSLSDYINWLSGAGDLVSRNQYIKYLRTICAFKQGFDIQSLAAELIQIECCMLKQGNLIACRDKYILLKLHILYFTATTPVFSEKDLKFLCFLYVITLFRMASDLKEIPNLKSKSDLISKAVDRISKHLNKPMPLEITKILNDIWSNLHGYDALKLQVDKLAGVSVTKYQQMLIKDQALLFKDLLERKRENMQELKRNLTRANEFAAMLENDII